MVVRIFDSLLTCVVLQLREGGFTTPPSFVTIAIHSHYSNSQRGGGGGVHHPPPLAADKQGGWVHHPPPPPPSAADKQGGVGPPPPPSFQRSGGKAPPPPTPHLAANLFLGFGVTRSRSSRYTEGQSQYIYRLSRLCCGRYFGNESNDKSEMVISYVAVDRCSREWVGRCHVDTNLRIQT